MLQRDLRLVEWSPLDEHASPMDSVGVAHRSRGVPQTVESGELRLDPASDLTSRVLDTERTHHVQRFLVALLAHEASGELEKELGAPRHIGVGREQRIERIPCGRVIRSQKSEYPSEVRLDADGFVWALGRLRKELGGLLGALAQELESAALQGDSVLDAREPTTRQVEVEARSGSQVSAPWTLRSGYGNVRLSLPDDFDAGLEARYHRALMGEIALYRELGVRRWYPSTYLSLLREGQRSILGPNRGDSFLSLLFNLGKKAGKVTGSIRFGFPSL